MKRPRRDSNPRTRLRRPLLYPLSYEGGTGEVTARERHDRHGTIGPMPQSRVLLVDDDPVILPLLEINLQMEGFAVLSARDGQEGPDMVRRERPDVVVSDVMMPRRNGLELAREMKDDPETGGIPVVLLSAKAQAADVQAGVDAGADEYVTKPFEPLEL